MRLRAAVVCDYAEVREGLLTIVSAGVTRLWRDTMPAPLGLYVALQIELDASERALPHEFQVSVKSPTGKDVAKARGGVQVQEGVALSDPGEVGVVSLPLDLRQAGIEEYGWHSIEIIVDDQLLDTIRVKVAPRPQPADAPLPLLNRQARRHSRPN